MLLSRLYDSLDMRGMRPADWKLDITRTAPVAIKFDLIHIRPCIRGKKPSVSEGLISILMNAIVAIHAFVESVNRTRFAESECECRKFGADVDPAALISPPTIINVKSLMLIRLGTDRSRITRTSAALSPNRTQWSIRISHPRSSEFRPNEVWRFAASSRGKRINLATGDYPRSHPRSRRIITVIITVD